MTRKEKSNIVKLLSQINNTKEFVIKTKADRRWKVGYIQALSNMESKIKEL
jgi:hypothetical protein